MASDIGYIKAGVFALIGTVITNLFASKKNGAILEGITGCHGHKDRRADARGA